MLGQLSEPAGTLRAWHGSLTTPISGDKQQTRIPELGNNDPAMFNEAFCGRAKLKPRCKHCLSDQHKFQDCHLVPPTTVEVRQLRGGPTHFAISLTKATIMLSCVVYLIKQWPTNVDTQISSMPIFVPCAFRALSQHHSARGPIAVSWHCLHRQSLQGSPQYCRRDNHIRPSLEPITSITMYHLSYYISN